MASIASRSIFIHAYPPPKSLSESKVILSRLQKYGRIATFRNLQYDVTNTARATNRALLAVFETAQSAEKALKASPIHIPLPPSSRATANPRLRNLREINNTTTTTESNQTPSNNSKPNNSNHKPPTRSHPPAADDANPLHPWTASNIAQENALPPDIRCELDWSRHNHELAQSRNPYHGFFDVDDRSVQYWDLKSVTKVPMQGLADCLMERRRFMGRKQKGEIDELNRELGVRSLWGVYEEGLRRKEGSEGLEED